MQAERDLIHPNERKYLIMALIASIFLYIILIVSITGIFFIIIFAAVSFFAHGIMMALIRTNGVKLSPTQFPEIYAKTEALCAKMEINKIPDIYVLQSGGVLNAFASRFFGRNMVVLYSEIFELINRNAQAELVFIIAHELAHIKRRHITKQLLILPAMWIPFLGEAYSRACEYTCDRFGAYYSEEPEAAKNSLIVLAVGKDLYRQVNQNEFLEQVEREDGFFIWLSEKISTHPPLPKRIHQINLFQNGEQMKTIRLKGCLVALILTLFIIIAGAYAIKYAIEHLDELGFPDLVNITENNSDLVTSVIEGDNEKLKTLIDQGTDVNQEDYEGWTALDWAIEDGNTEAAMLLIRAGADVNHVDYQQGVSPLMRASSQGYIDLMKILMEKGAVINHQDAEGYTALMYAVINQQDEATKLLVANGANTQIKNSDQSTALMYAIKYGNPEIVTLLKMAAS